MALGKPMVQFDVTEGRFSAQDASLYAKANDPVDLAEKIAGLLDDPEARAAMGNFGRTRVERELSWTHQVAPLIAAYTRAFR
jgi:glycosyltransferase involved in cell wall biosynthesis